MENELREMRSLTNLEKALDFIQFPEVSDTLPFETPMKLINPIPSQSQSEDLKGLLDPFAPSKSPMLTPQKGKEVAVDPEEKPIPRQPGLSTQLFTLVAQYTFVEALATTPTTAQVGWMSTMTNPAHSFPEGFKHMEEPSLETKKKTKTVNLIESPNQKEVEVKEISTHEEDKAEIDSKVDDDSSPPPTKSRIQTKAALR